MQFHEELLFEGQMEALKISNYKKKYTEMVITEDEKR